MAILRSGILGRASGKVAGVVGSHWKDKSYIREYVIPANPDTDPQKLQRGKLTDAVAFCKPLVGPVFNEYGDKFEKSMSGFNRFISQNIAIFDGTPVYETIKLTLGKLWGPAVMTAELVAMDIVVSFASLSLGNNGAATDKIYACSYETASGLWYFAAAEVERSTGEITVPVGHSTAVGTYPTYAWAAKYSITSSTLLEMVSDSSCVAIPS